MTRLPAPCGTRAAYLRHKRDGEPVDEACAQASRDARKKYRTGTRRPNKGEGPTQPVKETPMTVDQVEQIARLSHTVFSDRQKAFDLAGLHRESSTSDASRVLRALWACRSDRTVRSKDAESVFRTAYGIENSEPVQRTTTKRKANNMSLQKPGPGQRWEEWAAHLLGLSDPTEKTCPTCHGTGKTVIKENPTKSAVQRIVRDGGPKLGVMGPRSFATWLGNPRLDNLTHIATVLGSDLETAVKFCTTLSNAIITDLNTPTDTAADVDEVAV